MTDALTGRLGFVRSALLRHSAERGAGVLERHAGDPQARTILIAGETPVLRIAGDSATSLLPLADLARAPSWREQLRRARVVRCWRPWRGPDAARAFGDDAGYKLLDLRSIAVQGVVPAEELGILATAKALLHWHAHHRFCAQCGAPTSVSCAGFRRDCGTCGAQHFPRTDPVAIMLVARGNRCLLGRRAGPDGGARPAGRLHRTRRDDRGRGRRETFEEAGVGGSGRYLRLAAWPFRPR